MAVQDIIRQAANQYGVSPEALIAIAQLESNFNPSARNPSSSAGGLFQFIDSTARGYGLQDRYDPVQASDAAARLARDNANTLREGLGREPTPGELYLAHQQGAGGALRLLRDPSANAASVLGSEQVRLNVPSGQDWRNMTTGDFSNLWVNKANNVLGIPVPPANISSAMGYAAPTPQVAQAPALAGISGMVGSGQQVQGESPQSPRGISGLMGDFNATPSFFPVPMSGGTSVKTTNGGMGTLMSRDGVREFDQRAFGRDRSVMRANAQAINDAIGSRAINRENIDRALAAGAQLYKLA